MPDDRYFYWTAMQFHRQSMFGRFPEPPQPIEPASQAAAPVPEISELAGLRDLLLARTSARSFAAAPLERATLVELLWSAYGSVGSTMMRRTVPSAGAVYALRVFVVAAQVAGLESGCYAWRPERSGLCLVAPAPPDVSAWFATTTTDHRGAAAAVFLAGDLLAMGGRYGERGYRYLLLESGHAMQNLCLAATAASVAHVPIGGFDDEQVSKGLRLDESTIVTYSAVLGPAEGSE